MSLMMLIRKASRFTWVWLEKEAGTGRERASSVEMQWRHNEQAATDPERSHRWVIFEKGSVRPASRPLREPLLVPH